MKSLKSSMNEVKQCIRAIFFVSFFFLVIFGFLFLPGGIDRCLLQFQKIRWRFHCSRHLIVSPFLCRESCMCLVFFSFEVIIRVCCIQTVFVSKTAVIISTLAFSTANTAILSISIKSWEWISSISIIWNAWRDEHIVYALKCYVHLSLCALSLFRRILPTQYTMNLYCILQNLRWLHSLLY